PHRSRETIGPSLEGLPSNGGVLGKARRHLAGSILLSTAPMGITGSSPSGLPSIITLLRSAF
ncbi:hypothetical protein ACC746_36875, partial [Rhizobium ruizarguesonis]